MLRFGLKVQDASMKHAIFESMNETENEKFHEREEKLWRLKAICKTSDNGNRIDEKLWDSNYEPK